MKKLVLLFSMFYAFQLIAQEAASLMEEGKKLELKFNEEAAIEKYKQAVQIQPSPGGYAKLVELSCSIGGRQADPLVKANYYQTAKLYTEASRKIDSTSAVFFYLNALVYSKLTEVEEKKEIMVNYIKLTKLYAGKAVAANPDMGKAYNALGRWHFEMLTLNPIKKTAVKLFYGGLPPASIDSAIACLEKCKTLEPYYCLNFYDLGRTYNLNRQYEKAIAVLQQLGKLPTRRQDDPAIKAQGAVLLQQLQ